MSPDQRQFNIIPSSLVKELNVEDELQRLQAVKQLEMTIRQLPSVRQAHSVAFIGFMSRFVEDTNYEIRLGALKILCIFVEKLGSMVNDCFRSVCTCARQVMSQTHQSKTIKQSLNILLLLTVENTKQPIQVLESLLEKIKDKSAKAKEECLNCIMSAVIKFPSDKFEPLRKVFFLIVPLLCDIKRNVRHACLECIAIVYHKLRLVDNNINNLLDNLKHVPDFHNSDEILPALREVIIFRIRRNKLPVLNPDMTIEYGLKLPMQTSPFQMTPSSNGRIELDIEWIVSASAQSAQSNLSTARSNNTNNVYSEPINNNNNGIHAMHRMANFDDDTIASSLIKQRGRQPSSNVKGRGLPWDELNDTTNYQTKSIRSREVAPLKAFPLNDDTDFLNPNLLNNGKD
jgi:hypothetical protein